MMKKKSKEVEANAMKELAAFDIEHLFQDTNAPVIDKNLVGMRIQINFEMDEKNEEGKNKLIWYAGEVIRVNKKHQKVKVTWDDERETDSCETLEVSKWNKQTKGSWMLEKKNMTLGLIE